MCRYFDADDNAISRVQFVRLLTGYVKRLNRKPRRERI